LNSSYKKNRSDKVPIPHSLLRYRELLDDSLRLSVPNCGNSVYKLLEYAMGWIDEDGRPVSKSKGKALRPTLCLLSSVASGGTIQSALPAAVALELIHNFSLIHDDIQDKDKIRHHRRTVWAVWGNSKALVAGDVLKIIADRSLTDVKDKGLNSIISNRINGLLTEAYLEMIEGQYLDLDYERRTDVGISNYLDMVSRKTGALIRSSMNIGALLGSEDDSVADTFRKCGSAVGYLFQVRDDILGIWGQETLTGKPVGSDIRRRKNTFPVVYTISKIGGSDKRELLHIYQKDNIDDNDVQSVLEIMDKVDTRSYAQDFAQSCRDDAVKLLSSVNLVTKPHKDLVDIFNFLLVREN